MNRRREPNVDDPFPWSILVAHGFSTPISIGGRASLADLFPKSRRCGIYVLGFADGCYYAGKSIDVVKRFAQHRSHHGDIESIAFRRCGKRELPARETETIRLLETNGVALRNRLIVELPALETDFDAIMAPAAQQRWLDDPEFDDLEGPRSEDEALRRRSSARVDRLLALKTAEQLFAPVGRFLLEAVPAVFRSEITFWSASCLPYGASDGLDIRINVGFQSVLDAGRRPDRDGPFWAWWIPRRLAELGAGMTFEEGQSYRIRRGRIHIAQVQPSGLSHGGRDQVLMHCWSPDLIHEMLDHREFLLGLRRFTMGLVRKGPCPMSRSHHPALVDEAVDREAQRIAATVDTGGIRL